MELIFGLGFMLICLFSVAKQSQAVARQKLAIDRAEQHRQEALEREQRNQQRVAESIKLQKDSTVRWESVSTESAKLQKETLRAIEEMILQQKETNMILSLLRSKPQKSNSNVSK